jgi:hypothetical protein
VSGDIVVAACDSVGSVALSVVDRLLTTLFGSESKGRRVDFVACMHMVALLVNSLSSRKTEKASSEIPPLLVV